MKVSFTQSTFASSAEVQTMRQGGYAFINPLLSCGFREETPYSEYVGLKSKVSAYVAESLAKGKADNISVYFRNINNEHWFGINENDTYIPASLLKVPVMIAYLKVAEGNAAILNKKVVFQSKEDENSAEDIKPSHAIQNGKEYSISDLLFYMIAYSDNNATQYLADHVDKNMLEAVYTDLDLPHAQSLISGSISAKVYSSLFHILYNATYLGKPLSQYALGLLSSVDFAQGLKAGLPKDITVAHKFGERALLDKDSMEGKVKITSRQLHDCGIVYYPKSPYALCIMTKGHDFQALEDIIGHISNMVYQGSGTFSTFRNG